MSAEYDSILSGSLVNEAKPNPSFMPLIMEEMGWTKDDNIITFSLHHRIDSYTAPDLDLVLRTIQDDEREDPIYKIILDMEDVDKMSSKGWWALIEAQKRSKRYDRGEIVFVEPTKTIVKSLRLVGMGGYFRIFTNNEDVKKLLTKELS